jgi:hypothetical protein
VIKRKTLGPVIGSERKKTAKPVDSALDAELARCAVVFEKRAGQAIQDNIRVRAESKLYARAKILAKHQGQ